MQAAARAGMNGLEWLGRRASLMLLVGVFSGLALPGLAAVLRPALLIAVACLLTMSMVRVEPASLRRALQAPFVSALALGWLLLGAPLLVAWLCLDTGLPPTIAQSVVLYAAAPPLVAATAYALMLGLDAAFALYLTILGTFIVPLTLPPLASALLGLALPLTPLDMTVRLAVMVACCAGAAWAIRRFAGAERLARRGRALDGVVVLLMWLFAVAIMDGVTARIVNDPGWLVTCALAACILNFGLCAAGAIGAGLLGVRRALTVGLLSGNRNLGLVVGAMAADAPAEVVAFVAVAQIPIYALPSLLRPITRRLLPTPAH
ncbi:hypothetical protein [Marinivivus vitaminiproducens]|uniref:hypothetical protein n=1 Tax=Marinivivus vitaminiproducens TaxID=3035935 RepID=UPI0027A76122|nr:hypothetical protein P4R82_03820 [Geminicoccaceae bacterium SCSIO 64248]